MGVIGGADGPTVIFISGDPVGLAATLLVFAAAIGGAVWFFLHRRKRKK